MKSSRQMVHPNQENKTGRVPYASPVIRNFSNTESLPGKRTHMENGVAKKSIVQRFFQWWKDTIRKIDFRSM